MTDLNANQIDFISNSRFSLKIRNYLEKNGCNEQTSEFTKLAINTLDNNGFNDGEVDWEEQIINQLTGKAKSVYDKLKGNDLMNKTIERFDGDTSHFVNLVIKLEDPDISNASGDTRYGSPIRIRLREGYINNRPSLFTALVILHEGVHAEIYRKIITRSQLLLTPPDTYTLPDGCRIDFPTLFDYYNDFPDNPHHNFMADYYRDALEQGLRDYAASIDKIFSDQLYKDLSWIGLHETQAWNNMYADSVFTANEQTRILNVYNKFIKSGTNECK